MCLEQIIRTYDEDYLDKKDKVLQNLFTKTIKNVNPSVLNVTKKKTYERIHDNSRKYKNKFSYIHYVSQQILESAYTENKKEISPIIRDMIVQFYNEYINPSDKINFDNLENKYEILVGYDQDTRRLYIFKKKTFVQLLLPLEQTGGGMFDVFTNIFSSKKSPTIVTAKTIKDTKDNTKEYLNEVEDRKPGENTVNIIDLSKSNYKIELDKSSDKSSDKFEITISTKTKSPQEILKTKPFKILNFRDGKTDSTKIKKWQDQFKLLSHDIRRYDLLSLLQKISVDKSKIENMSTKKKKKRKFFS